MQTASLKIIALCLALLPLSGHDAAAEYVRKRVLPDYFIPSEDLQPKQEKLPPIKYLYGEEDSISVRSYDSLPKKQAVPPATANAALSPQENTALREETERNTPELEESPSLQSETPRGTAEKDVPAYQQKYQEYLRDVKKVAAGKKMPSNPQLNKDLSKMNSDERILLDQKFNAQRDALGDFKNALGSN